MPGVDGESDEEEQGADRGWSRGFSRGSRTRACGHRADLPGLCLPSSAVCLPWSPHSAFILVTWTSLQAQTVLQAPSSPPLPPCCCSATAASGAGKVH